MSDISTLSVRPDMRDRGVYNICLTAEGWYINHDNMAPESWDSLARAHPDHHDLLVKAGLLIRRDGMVYDRFRARYVESINDDDGELIGFDATLTGKDG